MFRSKLDEELERRRSYDCRQLLDFRSRQIDDRRRCDERIVARVETDDRVLRHASAREVVDVARGKRIRDEAVRRRPRMVEDDQKLRLSCACRENMEYRSARASLRMSKILVKPHRIIVPRAVLIPRRRARYAA